MSRLISILLTAAALHGCAPLMGDYVVYRVAYSNAEYSAECYSDGQVPEDVTDDMSSFLDTDTFVLIKGSEGAYYLEMGDQAIAGERVDGGYRFEAESVDKDYGDEDWLADEVWTWSLRVDVEGRGARIEGTVKSTETYSCSGADCWEDAGDECTMLMDFVGTKVGGVDINYEV